MVHVFSDYVITKGNDWGFSTWHICSGAESFLPRTQGLLWSVGFSPEKRLSTETGQGVVTCGWTGCPQGLHHLSLILADCSHRAISYCLRIRLAPRSTI